jgi:hypothetical protein
MPNISSGHTQLLQNRALHNDRKNALIKVQNNWKAPCCPNNIKPVAQVVSSCPVFTTSSQTLSQINSGQQSSSNHLTNKVNNLINYTAVVPKCGVPESVRIQQVKANTADAAVGLAVRNPDGSFSYLPNPYTRFNQYLPYTPSCPCGNTGPYNATNAGDPVARIPPCVAPKILYI